MSNSRKNVTKAEVQDWLVEKFAGRLGVDKSSVDVTMPFPEFNLDSVEAILLTGELESWLGIEMQPTALWYHPTMEELSTHVVDDLLSEVA